MKKNIAVLLIVTFFAFSAAAQNLPANKLFTTLGVSFNGNGDVLGPSVNIGYEKMLNEKFSAQAFLSVQNMKADQNVGIFTHCSSYGLYGNVHYPVVNGDIFKLKLGAGLNLRYFYWRLHTGPNAFIIYGFKKETIYIHDGETALYNETNIGYNISIQTQFKLSDKVQFLFWPHLGNDFHGNIVTSFHAGVGIEI